MNKSNHFPRRDAETQRYGERPKIGRWEEQKSQNGGNDLSAIPMPSIPMCFCSLRGLA